MRRKFHKRQDEEIYVLLVIYEPQSVIHENRFSSLLPVNLRSFIKKITLIIEMGKFTIKDDLHEGTMPITALCNVKIMQQVTEKRKLLKE